MIIHYIKLTDYKRIKLNNLKTIEIDFSEPLQLILGTNGCGKSSILSELTPYPPSSEFYSKGGGKVIHISHHNCSYILSTVFSKAAGEHSFIKNGIELNPGRTLTIQKSLVLSEFGISQDILNLLLGFEKFTKMDPAKRSEWFTRLDAVDYNYSLSVYAKVKEQYRDVVGTIRTANKRLAVETSSEIDIKEELKLKDKLDSLYTRITDLYKLKMNTEFTEQEIKSLLHTTIDQLHLSNKQYHKNVIHKPNSVYQLSIPDIEEKVKFLYTKKTTTQERINNFVSQYLELDNKYKQIKVINKELEETNVSSIALFNLEIEKAKKELTTNYITNVENISLENIKTTMSIINDLVSTLPDNTDQYFTRNKQTEANQLKVVLEKNKEKLTEEHRKLLEDFKHISNDINKNIIECPSCQYKWSKSNPEKTLEELQILIKEKEFLLEENANKTIINETYLIECKEYENTIKLIYTTLSSNPELSQVKEYIIQNKLIQNNPRSITVLLYSVEKEITIKNFLSNKLKTLSHLLEINKIKEDNSHVNINDLKINKDKLNESIEELSIDIKNITIEYTSTKQYLDSLSNISTITNNIQTYLEKLNSLVKDLIKVYQNNTLQNEIELCREEITNLSKRLDCIVRRNTVIKDIEKEIEINKKKEAQLKLLMKHLNPNDGLIADSLFGFIKVFVERMNKILEKIWAYPMKILPCKMQDNDSVVLDYKFPIVFNDNEDNETKDVSKGSEGIQEIINYAFRETAMSFLKLEDYPLYLDEFGSTFDPTHKPLAINMIKELMEQEAFSQMFFISHYSECHEVFSNAEVCLLCDKNIQLENSKLQLRVNHHVRVEKNE